MLVQVASEFVSIEAEPFQYQVLIPDFVRRMLEPQLTKRVSLYTVYYLDGDPSRGKVTPRLVGFMNEVEREFFDMFCSVDGVGAKKALRAMVRPVQDIAEMIEEQDVKGLSALPGVGPATAERIIAKLRRKMSKFALLVTMSRPAGEDVKRDVLRETFDALLLLGHHDADARRLIDSAVASKKKFDSVDALLHAIYEQNHSKREG